MYLILPNMLQRGEFTDHENTLLLLSATAVSFDMTTMDDRINMRTSDNTAYARTTSLIAIRKFRNLTRFHSWVTETHKFFNEINETHEYDNTC